MILLAPPAKKKEEIVSTILFKGSSEKIVDNSLSKEKDECEDENAETIKKNEKINFELLNKIEEYEEENIKEYENFKNTMKAVFLKMKLADLSKYGKTLKDYHNEN